MVSSNTIGSHTEHASMQHASMEHAHISHSNMIMDFKVRFFVSLLATIPLLFLSSMIQHLFSFSIEFPGDKAILVLLSSFIYTYGGWPFLKGFASELTQKKAGMMALVAIAITSAYLYSILVSFQILKGEEFFWEVATLVDIMLLGHYIEMKSISRASKSLEKLVQLLPTTVNILLPNGSLKIISQKDLKVGDLIMVKPGERIPSDGLIIDGSANIDLSMITGESKPVQKKKNDSVIGGSVNQDGSLIVQIKKTGEESYLSKIISLVKLASESKSRAQTLADKAAFLLTIIAITSGIITFAAWLLYGFPLSLAIANMISVMVITCPHALGLAIPLVVSSITSLSARAGLLIKNRTAFEQAYKCNMLFFDKTGTLTTGTFGVTKIVSTSNLDENTILKLSAAIERRSEHSIAKAIVAHAEKNNIFIPQIANFKAIPGIGVSALVEKDVITIGTPELISGKKNASAAANEVKKLVSMGKTVVVVTTQDEVKGLLALSDTVRVESLEACAELKKYNIKLALITGDNETVANNVADQLGITKVVANVLPDQKVSIIKSFQEKGYYVGMVGDGINDAPALAQANVGIAIGSGTDIAAETSDVILVGSDPRDVVNVIKLSRLMKKKMFQNLAWATGYNLFAIPFAAGLFHKYGISISPSLGAIAMSLSTIIVTINSRLIKITK